MISTLLLCGACAMDPATLTLLPYTWRRLAACRPSLRRQGLCRRRHPSALSRMLLGLAARHCRERRVALVSRLRPSIVADRAASSCRPCRAYLYGLGLTCARIC